MVEAWIRRRGDGERVSLQRGANPQSRAGKEGVMISSIGHVALQVPNLDASVAWATTVMGLREVAREGKTSYLTHGGAHHSLIYIEAGEGALDHISLQARDEKALNELTDRLAKHGVKTIDHQRETAVKQSIRFEGPDGHVFEVYTGLNHDQPRHTGRGVQPKKFGHPMLKSERPRETQQFIEQVLGFRLSDDVGDGTLLFLRCNADHHGIGITRGGDGLHHYAWEVESLAILGQLGYVVEYYADLIKIYDEASYHPGQWVMSDYRFANLWGPGIPGHEFFDAGAP